MTREQFDHELECWLMDVRQEARTIHGNGTPAPQVLELALERVCWRWLQAQRAGGHLITPYTLQPRA